MSFAALTFAGGLIAALRVLSSSEIRFAIGCAVVASVAQAAAAVLRNASVLDATCRLTSRAGGGVGETGAATRGH